MKDHPHVIKALTSELWAITPEALNQIILIANGFGDPEAVAAKLGKPLANTHQVIVRNDKAIIPVIGPIFRYANLFTQISGATSVENLATDLQAALDDSTIKAVIFEIDSPGGQVSGISELAAQIRAANGIKPVTAYISDIGASAAYWLASAAGDIVTANTARVGSIGTVLQIQPGDEEGTVKFISSQSPLKHADPTTDEGQFQYQKIADSLTDVFINTVANYRNTTRENVIVNYGQGFVVIAEQAIKAGMVDRLGSLESIINSSAQGGTISFPTGSLKNMSTLTKETLQAEHAELYQAILDEGIAKGQAEGKKTGAEEERARIQSIEDLASMGHDELIKQFKFDGKTTAAEAALKINQAEKAALESMKEQRKNDKPPTVPHATAAFNDGKKEESNGLKGEEKWKYDYEHDESLQAEFHKLENYLAYMRAESKGSVQILGAKTS